MAIVQFSVTADTYVNLVERAARLGMSEHQLAKCLAGLADVTDEDILQYKRALYGKRSEGRNRARPL